MKMPVIKMNNLEGDTLMVAKAITKKDGSIYASKPKNANGFEKYIWRNIVFMVSPKKQHQCMAVTAVFDLYDWIEKEFESEVYKYKNKVDGKISVYEYARKEEFIQNIEDIENNILDAIPKSEWHGVQRIIHI